MKDVWPRAWCLIIWSLYRCVQWLIILWAQVSCISHTVSLNPRHLINVLVDFFNICLFDSFLGDQIPVRLAVVLTPPLLWRALPNIISLLFQGSVHYMITRTLPKLSWDECTEYGLALNCRLRPHQWQARSQWLPSEANPNFPRIPCHSVPYLSTGKSGCLNGLGASISNANAKPVRAVLL